MSKLIIDNNIIDSTKDYWITKRTKLKSPSLVKKKIVKKHLLK